MPGIFKIECDHCDYRAIGDSHLAVLMPDGSEEICPKCKTGKLTSTMTGIS